MELSFHVIMMDCLLSYYLFSSLLEHKILIESLCLYPSTMCEISFLLVLIVDICFRCML